MLCSLQENCENAFRYVLLILLWNLGKSTHSLFKLETFSLFSKRKKFLYWLHTKFYINIQLFIYFLITNNIPLKIKSDLLPDF